VRGEDHGRLAGPDTGVQGSLDLDHVPVRADRVGLEVLVPLGEVVLRLGLAPGTAHAAGGIHDHLVWINQPGLQQRQDPQGRGCRIAARIGDQPGAADLLAVQLRQAVNGVGQILQVGMLLVVPLFVVGRLLQPIVGGEVNHAEPRLQQRGHELRGHSVG